MNCQSDLALALMRSWMAAMVCAGWCRGTLCKIAAWGPLTGAAVSLTFVLLGLGLTMSGQGSTEVQTSAFEDSFLVGGLGSYPHLAPSVLHDPLPQLLIARIPDSSLTPYSNQLAIARMQETVNDVIGVLHMTVCTVDWSLIS